MGAQLQQAVVPFPLSGGEGVKPRWSAGNGEGVDPLRSARCGGGIDPRQSTGYSGVDPLRATENAGGRVVNMERKLLRRQHSQRRWKHMRCRDGGEISLSSY